MQTRIPEGRFALKGGHFILDFQTYAMAVQATHQHFFSRTLSNLSSGVLTPPDRPGQRRTPPPSITVPCRAPQTHAGHGHRANARTARTFCNFF